MRINHPKRLKLRSLVFVLLLFFSLKMAAQNCTCLTQFEFVQNYFEDNNPAFQKIKNNQEALRSYQKQAKRLAAKIKREKSADRCNLYFEKYIDLIKDNHSGIGFDIKRLDIDFSADSQLDSFKNSATYRSFKKKSIDTTAIISKLRSKELSDIEGLYTNSGGIYMGIMAGKKGTYYGVVLRKNRFLEPGHVLLELKAKGNNTFEAAYHTGLMGYNLNSICGEIGVKNGEIPAFRFYKEGRSNASESATFAFSEIDPQTNYLRLGSFDGNLKPALDSLYQSIDLQLKSKPYLIIDLRDNGGGDERCYFGLMPYIYTHPLKVDSVEVWVSPENIKRYEEAGAERHRRLIERMKAATPYSFIPQVENAVYTWALDSATVYPKKIVMLFNRNTASSAEGLITYAMQSEKVITLGENSGGYVGYGNLMEVKIPCSNFTLKSTTTRYSNNSRYEFAGIEPMFRLSAGTDWIKAAMSHFHPVSH